MKLRSERSNKYCLLRFASQRPILQIGRSSSDRWGLVGWQVSCHPPCLTVLAIRTPHHLEGLAHHGSVLSRGVTCAWVAWQRCWWAAVLRIVVKGGGLVRVKSTWKASLLVTLMSPSLTKSSLCEGKLPLPFISSTAVILTSHHLLTVIIHCDQILLN